MTAGSFEKFAAWWDAAVGEEGDEYHRHFILPALLRSAGPLEGVSVVDLGCGNGASSRHLARAGGKVTGVDISETLITLAREREQANPRGIEYVVSDIAGITALPDETFDRATANMVLMDVENCAGAIAEASRLLKPGGRFIATLFHPCFQVPDGSSWLEETVDFDTRYSRRVWRYLEVFSASGIAKPNQPEQQTYYHRPLSWYAGHLVKAGLLIDCLDEPMPDTDFAERRPDVIKRFTAAPFLLVLGAQKVST